MSNVRPRLAILTPLPPFPPMAGGTRHTYGAALHLARHYQVELLALAEDAASVTWGRLADRCATVRAFQRSAPRGSLFDPPAARMERSEALDGYIERVWARHPPDVVQIEYTTMAHYAPQARKTGALVVCMAPIVGFVAQARRLHSVGNMRLRRLAGLFSLWQYELRALPACDLVITLAESDERALRRWLPKLPVATVPSGIDLADWPEPHGPREAELVLFVGNFAHPPNAEGALWLAREVWPRVLAQRPGARLVLAGRWPTPEMRALADASIAVPGAVEDLLPLYQRAAVGVAPIFWGGGLRIKLLEMMAAGLPVVTTPQAADGLDARGWAVLARAPQTFADAIVALFGDQDRRERMGALARATVERRYDWVRLAARLAGLYEGARAGKS
jgi:glycosyltransferase involved in cell wall biosynthesis